MDQVLFSASGAGGFGDYVEFLDTEIREALEKAFLAGAAWAATKNEGWATPEQAAAEFPRWLDTAS